MRTTGERKKNELIGKQSDTNGAIIASQALSHALS